MIDVRICFRGNCHDELESSVREEEFGCGFKEMNKCLKYLYYKEDFTKDSLEKDEYILSLLDS